MSDINVIVKTQRIVVDAPTRTVSVLMAGPQGPAGVAGTTRLAVPFHTGSTVLSITNAPSAERFLHNNAFSHVKPFPDADQFTHARVVGYVSSASTSTNSPKMTLKYKTGAWSSTVGDYADLGVTPIECALSSVGLIDSGWIAKAAGFTGDCLIAITEQGGDGVADYILGNLSAYFK